MPYTVKSSEKTRKSGSDGETKALLYLMNFRNDSDEIYYFVIDFFNDLTGMDRYASKLWDIQSKAALNNSPKVIGKELVTLFKNYMSEIDFAYYILFVGGVTSSFRLNKSFPIFRTIDFCKKAPLLSHLQIPAYTLTELFCKNYTTLQIKSGIAPSVACQIVLKSIVYIVLFCYNWTIYFTQFS